jgi:hypothetical protein
MMPLWAVELAAWFWVQVGQTEPFPRRLRAALESGAFDVTLKELSRLSVRMVENYLAHQGIFRLTNEPDRPLRACVAAHGAAAWVFLDASDPGDEKTASIAHEFAHFLRQCLQPRLRAIEALGPGIAAVLDGHREPTPAEKFSAVLRGLTLGVRVHYLRRDGGRLPPAEEKVEVEADLLAWQLLAPFAEVERRAGDQDELEQVRALLMTHFGLPATMADDYADYLCPPDRGSPVVQKLRQLVRACRDRGGADQ